MPTLRGILGSLVGIVFEYNTPKFVRIGNKAIGAINRLIQLGIIAGMIVAVVVQKDYLESAPLVSVITTKVKGAKKLSNESNEWRQNCFNSSFAYGLLDHTDLVVPPQEPNSFFVTTNLWMTCKQTLGTCAENPGVSNCTDRPCPVDELLNGGNGITTGRCLEDGPDNTCEVTAWCPVEKENDSFTKLEPKIDVRNFTVTIKNSVTCPVLDENFIVRNFENPSSLKNCTHNKTTEKGIYCAKFSLGYLLEMIDGNRSYNDLATEGAIVGIEINWDCVVDPPFNTCYPTYSARQLDKSARHFKNSGYNFRYPHYYYIDGVQYRDLIKAYGILFVIQVTGECHTISYVNIFVSIGAMIGWLAIATIICDILVLYTPSCILPRSSVYRQKKYQNVDIQEADGSGGYQYGAIGDDSDLINKPTD